MTHSERLAGPWTIGYVRNPAISNSWIKGVLDAGGQPLWTGFAEPSALERIVADHNRPRSGVYHTAVIDHAKGKVDYGGFDYAAITREIAEWCLASWEDTLETEPDPEADAAAVIKDFFDQTMDLPSGFEAYLHRAEHHITFPLK